MIDDNKIETATILLDEAHRMLDTQSTANYHLDVKASFVLAISGGGLTVLSQFNGRGHLVVASFQFFTLLFALATGGYALQTLMLRWYAHAPKLLGLEKYWSADSVAVRKQIFANLRKAVEDNENNVLPSKKLALRSSYYAALITFLLIASLGILNASRSTFGEGNTIVEMGVAVSLVASLMRIFKTIRSHQGGINMEVSTKGPGPGSSQNSGNDQEIIVPDPDLEMVMEKGLNGAAGPKE